MGKILPIITGNPYRQFGVYSNASKKEMTANQGRINAFLKVGRTVEFPLDLPKLLPSVDRTAESIADANSKLALPKEQLKYAQFWFAKQTTFDDIAFNHLFGGNVSQAVEIWAKKDTVSSLQNRIVCALINGDNAEAIRFAEKLYGGFSAELIKMILGENATVSPDELAFSFLDVLCDELGASSFINTISNNEWREYVGSKTVKPLIDGILSAIETAKQAKESTTRLQAGKRLMNETKSQLALLRQYLKPDDLQYQMVADKLGIEILQCAIDYFNDTEDVDAPSKAKELQDYAMKIVAGQMAKDRCKENVEILNDIIKKLPPKEVMAEDRAIKEELRKFCNLPDKICYAITLLNNTKPHLQAIKNKLGATNSFYLKVSTSIVGNALHNIIEEVNNTQSDPNFKLNMIIDKAQALITIQRVLREAWKATQIMDTFDMENDFKTNRYNSQRSALRGLCQDVGVSTYTPSPKPPVNQPKPSNPSNDKIPGWLAYCIGVVAVGIIGAIFNGGEGFGVGCFWGLLFGGPIAKAILSE